MPFLCGALRVHADPGTCSALLLQKIVLILFILRKGIKNNVIADLHQFFHIFFLISRCKYMIFLSHLLFSKARLKNSARRRSADILPDQRIQ